MVEQAIPIVSCVGVTIVAILVLFFLSIETISSGHVGVIKRFGAIQTEVMTEGFNTKMPFADTVVEIDIRMADVTYFSNSFSKDLQSVKTEASVQYSLVGGFVAKMYQKIGKREIVDQVILQPAIAESLKATTAQFSTEELIQKRQTAKNLIMDNLKKYVDKSLRDKGLIGAIEISNLALTDFQFSEKFNLSIEAKIRAEQEALQAENEKKKIVTQAEAASKKKKIEAEAAAFEIEKMATARANAIKAEANALKNNPHLIELRIAESWDGRLPQMTGNGGIPLLDMSNFGQNNRQNNNNPQSLRTNSHPKRRTQRSINPKILFPRLE